MIRLIKINKYFYHHKKNEIHVIDNTSLEFDKQGLVALLGPSGCGKTTLLNCIGGLDKINSGKIFINGKKMPKKCSYKKDKMRVLNIGYIFQDYNLLDQMSVFDNVAMSLKMIGLKNKSEVKKRVNYILETVGMYRYRNKPAGALSGGQRQRVGIARALVKNPDIIIADEPTGNLDSKNTIEIMNIIKAISKNKLVILVTHEKDLAHFYASRIINIEDGKIISDKENEHDSELDYRIDNNIYLKDFSNVDKFDSHNINIYSDKKEKLNLDIVIKNGNIYIKSLNNNKIEIVDEHSGLEFIDDYYKKISKDDYKKHTFNMEVLEHKKNKLRYTSIYNIFSMLKTGFVKVMNYPVVKKLLLIGFFISSMFIVFAISGICGALNVQEKNFLDVNRNYIKISNNKNDLKTYLEVEKIEGIEYVIPGNSKVTMKIEPDRLFQLQESDIMISGSIASSNILTKESIIYGRTPENNSELVLDFTVIDKAFEELDIKMLNLHEIKDVLGLTLSVGGQQYKVVGVSNSLSPCIYVVETEILNIISKSTENNYIIEDEYDSYTYKKYDPNNQDITIKRGRAPENDYEVIVNIDNQYSMPLYKTIDAKINDTKLKVVGYYYSMTGNNDYYIGVNTYKYNTIVNSSGMTLYASDKEVTISKLQDMGYNAEDIYQHSREKYLYETKESVKGLLIISGILLAISFVEIFLMIRASFMSRIKEIGIYRAIGVKKTDIYKMFLGEILVITTLAGLPGAILMGSIVNEITKIKFLATYYVINQTVMMISILLIYLLNIIVGLVPIRNIIKNTPAQILSRNDVD